MGELALAQIQDNPEQKMILLQESSRAFCGLMLLFDVYTQNIMTQRKFSRTLSCKFTDNKTNEKNTNTLKERGGCLFSTRYLFVR